MMSATEEPGLLWSALTIWLLSLTVSVQNAIMSASFETYIRIQLMATSSFPSSFV